MHPLPSLKPPYTSSIKPSVTLQTLSKILAYIFPSMLNKLFKPIILAFLIYLCTVEQLQQISTFYHFSCDLILTCSLSIFELAHSHLNLSSSNWLSSEVVTSLNPIKATHVDCNLFQSIYILQIFKNTPSRSFALHTPPLPTSNFHPLFCHNPPPSSFHITHLLPKQFPISIHIIFHLPSKLLIYCLFAVIYTLFNLSLLLCVVPYIFLLPLHR